MKTLKRIGVVMFFVGLVAMVIFVKVSNAKLDTYTAIPEVAPQTLDQRWEANYEKDVQLEMQREGFKKEIDAYALDKAQKNVQRAYVTKLQQKVN